MTAAMLHVIDLTFRFSDRLLFEGASMSIPAGHKVGLVGRNGSGKSTLFRLIRDDLQTDGGSITLPSYARIGWVAQEAPDGQRSLIDTVLAADEERSRLLAAAETVELAVLVRAMAATLLVPAAVWFLAARRWPPRVTDDRESR